LKVPGSNPGPSTNLNPAAMWQGFLMSEMKLYQVYVLRNPQGVFYVGLSEDVAVRLAQHNNGISKWTRSRGQWSLAWISDPLNLSEARKLETPLKRQKRGEGFYKLTGLARSSG